MMIGRSIQMSLAKNKTFELWQSFMSRRKEIQNAASTDLYSIQIYDDPLVFKTFNPNIIFKKIVAIEVQDLNIIPNEMEAFILESNLYAVFIHKGPSSEFHKTFQYVFNEWLPSSEYILDDREHF